MTLTPLIRPAARPDWFWIPAAWGPLVANLGHLEPGNYGRDVGIHRSYLPVLAEARPEAAEFLTRLEEEEDLDERARFDAVPKGEALTLRPYQHVGREFLRSRAGALLADQMRLGKSATAIAAHDPADGPLLVVAPLPTREVWLRWMHWRWPDVEPVVLTGRKYDAAAFEGAKLIFAHYDVLAGWQSIAFRVKIGTLILDEIHLLANPKSKRSVAACMLAPSSKRRIGLSGSPMWNRPMNLLTILSVIAPGAFGSPGEFGRKYCDPQMTAWGTKYEGASNVDEFKRRMSEVMLRREWKDVRADLPAITRTTEVASISAAETLKIDVALEDCREGARGERTVVGDLARLRRLLGEFKVPLTADCADRVLREEPVVVWVWHNAVGLMVSEKLARLGHPSWLYTGAMSQDQRDAALAAWRASAKPGALIVSIAVGQAGVDFSHAAQAIFGEVDWTPATIGQAEMRTFSPARPMFLTYIVVDHEVDRRVVGALFEKCSLGDQLGMPAAEGAIEVIARAFGGGASDPGDLARLAAAIIDASAPCEGDDDDDD